MKNSDVETKRRPLIAAAALLGLLLYGLTCAPGVLWQDSAMFQFRVLQGDVAGDLGLPLAHPLYILLAKAFSLLPLGDFAFRVNLFSAVCGAACLGLAIDLLLSLTRSRSAAITGTALLAVSHTFWTHSVIAEVYTLYGVGLLAELWLLQRLFTGRQARWLFIALVVNGLNASNHLLAILHAPAYLGVVIWALQTRRIRIAHLPLLSVAFLVGAAPYLALIIADVATGQPLLETLKQALVGPPNRAGRVLTISFPLLHQTVRAGQYFAMNFPTPVALAAPLGAWLAWRDPRIRWFALVAGTIFAVSFLFAFRYLVPDQFVFFFPCYILVPLFVAIGVSAWAKASTARRVTCLVLAILPAAVYEFAPPVLARRNVSIGVKRHIPLRDTYTYFLRPRKNGNDGAARFAREALVRAGPDGLLIADSTIMNVLTYVRQVEGAGSGVTLTRTADVTPDEPTIPMSAEAVEPFARRSTAYTCSNAPGYTPQWILERYNLVPIGHLFRLRTED